MNVKDWIFDWFANNTDIIPNVLENNLEKNYFDQQWLDSFQFIVFISSLEQYFNIRFDNSVFQQKSFATLSGLIAATERMINV